MKATISSWLNLGRPAPPGRGSAAGRKFWAPPYYNQRAMFASLWALFWTSQLRHSITYHYRRYAISVDWFFKAFRMCFYDNALSSHPSTAQLKPVDRNWAFTVLSQLVRLTRSNTYRIRCKSASLSSRRARPRHVDGNLRGNEMRVSSCAETACAWLWPDRS